MNKIPFLHYKKKKNDLINLYMIVVVILTLFSIYKNGIILYTNGLIHLYNIALPIYFYLISIIIGLILSLILKENKKEMILLCLIISLSISINTNMVIYPILLFVSVFIGKYIENKTRLSISCIAFSRVLLILALLMNSYSYFNIGEKLDKFNYNLFDTFLGYGPGGLSTTSLLLVIISFIILSSNKFYKKIIPISASISFLLCSGLIMFFTKDLDFFKVICNGTVYFSFVLIAPDIMNTPTERKGMFIYGILIGILSSIFAFLLNYYEAGILSVLICSLFIPLINKINNKKYYRRKN